MSKIEPGNGKPFLYDFQMEAVKRAFVGCVFNGQVGSGKSRTGLFFYFKEQGGWIDENGYIPMENPKDLYIITTAMKRDKHEWEGELIPFQMYPKPELNRYANDIVIDSWNNVQKYIDVKNAFFIFDEQRVVGKGAWVKSFLKIANCNDWIMLSATPGDTWIDYVPLFIANGFYRNRTEFNREHVEYDPYCRNFPKIKGYHNTGRLIRLRNKILIDMDFKRPTVQHHEDETCSYDIAMYKDAIRNRWDPFKNEPIQQASGLCYVLRRIVNSDESRQVKLLELLEDHPKAIIFYNFDYERDILLNLGYEDGTEIAEWSGHAHQPIPTGDRWVYLTNYVAGCEGWNTTTTDTIIFFSQNYSYKVMTQAAGRIDRMNTKFVDLYYYHLSGANLSYTNLSGAKNTNYPIACPEKGSFTAFKRVRGDLTINMDPIDGTTIETSTRIDPFRALDKIDKPPKTLSIKEVIFNPPATIVFWSDNTKTIVKCDYEYEEYDPEKGIAMAIAKKLIGDNKRDYYNVFRHWMKKWENKDK